MIIGIDNGSCSGAAVALSAWDGEVIGYTSLPNHKVRNKTELDMIGLRDWILSFNLPPASIVVEEPLHHAPSSQSIRSMALCYGQIMGLCTGMAWRCEGVTVREWQSQMLGKFPKGQSKKYAMREATKRCPKEKWLDPNKPRSKKPHDGIVDAFLIAAFEYQRFIGEKKT